MIAFTLSAALLASPGAADFPAARPVVPFTEEGDVGCHWTMHGDGEKWIRGGIGQGDEDPVISLVDHAFDRWGDRDDYAMEVSAGDPATSRHVTSALVGDHPASLQWLLVSP